MNHILDRGARVTFRPGSKAQANWRISDGMDGLVLACYRTHHQGMPERVDVRFNSGVIVWGERASEFIPIEAEALQ